MTMRKKQPEANIMIQCPACWGNGVLFHEKQWVDCPSCKGSGQVSLDSTVPNEYPKHISTQEP